MQNQLPRFQLWPLPGSDLIPVDIFGVRAIRTGRGVYGRYLGDAIDQALVPAQPLAAIGAGIKMRLELARGRRRPPRARATLDARRYQGVEFFSIDVFVRATRQSRKLSNF